ncbi:3-hydroxyisobutyrate dehydrogenase [Prauserella marina]|uniref:3-hydroxyisobutyrate dehydrogenase n=1 Tax=Prauserella marina TaxID=530584 RepID=A0A222VSN8_9PSEU|nr:NAD(P)-dependent oxidoreductase [Prauserella marina]ASR36924.1 3-hydroxyisobutyrate dehydrogenase [Prauserella marina]PWV80127.1 3-hydroxyisobutyrate dehydrogenase [Prauserella marina]SDD47696.1 3-hydroxyisobutyrate dehydrogenase [Prauserella marina]
MPVPTPSPTVAVLGTGTMGEPMAANLLGAGLPVRVWNRTTAKTRALAERGAIVADTPREAVAGAGLVVTMLSEGRAVHDTVNPALEAFAEDAVWLQMSTVGPEWTAELAALAADAGVAFVDAPVLGTRAPAEQGTLVVLASGPLRLGQRCAPVFDTVGSRTMWVGLAGAASKLKLVVNTWLLGLTNAAAESIALAHLLGVDPKLFLEAIEGGPLDAAYAHAKGEEMIAGDYPPSFTAALAMKDAELALASAGEADLGGLRATLSHLSAVVESGHADEDMAVLYRGVTDAPRHGG